MALDLSHINSRNRKAGYSSEEAAAAQLRAMGFHMEKPTKTGWRVVRGWHGRIIRAFPRFRELFGQENV